jgi:non-specific serine/threonine protein kinase
MTMLMSAVRLIFDTDWRELCAETRRALIARSPTVAHLPLARAIAQLEEGLPIFREAGDVPNLLLALTFFAVVALEMGDESRSMALLEEALARSRQAGDRLNEGRTLLGLEDLAFARGDFARATEWHAAGAAAFQAHGDATYISLTMVRQGYLLWARGDLAGAAAQCSEALALAQRVSYFAGIAEGLEALTVVLSDLGQSERAARALGAAESLRTSMGSGLGRSARPTRLVLIDRAIAALRATLGDEAYASAFAAGRTMPLEEAVAEVLGEAD